jgi:hypothetical protein
VIELDGGDVLEPIEPPRRFHEIPGRKKPPVHQGEGVVGEPGVESGDEAAGEDRQEHERGERARGAAEGRGRDPGLRRSEKVERGPENRGVDDEREP